MLIEKKKYMYKLAEELFPINRSITGNGLRESLKIIKREIPNLKIRSVKSGTKIFDWIVPKEWNVEDAYIEDPSGKRIVDINNSNLHLVGYSKPINTTINLDKLQNYLFSLPDQENAIPYVTTYYKENWGFCITHNQRKKLKKGDYKVVIKSELKKGELNYGELIIPGKSKKEIFFSTYICHPSMANNEISGPVCLTAIVKELQKKKNNFTYRIVFIPETIGSLCYLKKNLRTMKKNIIAGFNITCVGDNNEYSYIPSRQGNTLADQVLLHVLENNKNKFKKYSFLDRGSDERQYCSPGADIPLVVFCRSKFGEYPEYHTSLDNLNFISEEGLEGSFDVLTKVISIIENNKKVFSKFVGEPQLGRRNLYPNLSIKNIYDSVQTTRDLLAYADGNSVLEIAKKIKIPAWELTNKLKELEKEKLVITRF